MRPERQYLEEMHPPPGELITGWFGRDLLVARLRAVLAECVPLGYEDETGFHFGMKTRYCEIPVNHLTDSRETARF